MQALLWYAGSMLQVLEDDLVSLPMDEAIALCDAAEKIMGLLEERMNKGKVADFAMARAIRENDAAAVTPLTLLKHLVEEMEAGRVRMDRAAIVWLEDDGDAMRRGAAFASVDRMQAVALLEVAKSDCVASWGPAR